MFLIDPPFSGPRHEEDQVHVSGTMGGTVIKAMSGGHYQDTHHGGHGHGHHQAVVHQDPPHHGVAPSQGPREHPGWSSHGAKPSAVRSDSHHHREAPRPKDSFALHEGFSHGHQQAVVRPEYHHRDMASSPVHQAQQGWSSSHGQGGSSHDEDEIQEEDYDLHSGFAYQGSRHHGHSENHEDNSMMSEVDDDYFEIPSMSEHVFEEYYES